MTGRSASCALILEAFVMMLFISCPARCAAGSHRLGRAAAAATAARRVNDGAAAHPADRARTQRAAHHRAPALTDRAATAAAAAGGSHATSHDVKLLRLTHASASLGQTYLCTTCGIC